MLMAKRRQLFGPMCRSLHRPQVGRYGKYPPVARIAKRMTVVSFIYRHVVVINMLKAHGNNKNLLPAETRLATSSNFAKDLTSEA